LRITADIGVYLATTGNNWQQLATTANNCQQLPTTGNNWQQLLISATMRLRRSRVGRTVG
jgi:hypothetical protein